MNPISQRLRESFARHAERVAVVDRGRSCTYAELDARVEGVTRELRAAGVQPQVVIALAGVRTLARVVDLVALFRVGAVPLLTCPRWPRAYHDERVLASGAGFTLEAGTLTRTARVGASMSASPDTGYIIYTSGSSGRPKGVLVSHAGLVPVLDAQVSAFGLDAESRSLFMLGLGFDASLSDLGTALLAGAALVLEDERELVPGRLLATVARRAVTYVDLPPAYLGALDERALPTCLRTLVVGGEVPPAHEVRRLAPHVALFNVYGPTEATICTSLVRCDAGWSRPLLGQPIAGLRYALRREQRARDGSAEGELLIAGPGVALGYHDDEAESAARFVQSEGERCFRTGDRVRRDPAGEWEFLGRIDRQLKRRGQLVAPEEVEAALLRCPGVFAASVTPSEDGARLVARVEAHVGLSAGERAQLVRRVRSELEASLPPALVPDVVELSESLARGATGKLLHDASPPGALASDAPLPGTLVRGACSAGSRAGVDAEVALLGAWMGRALGRAPLGPDEDFFHAGGDSLRALDVVARAEAAGLGVPTEALARGRTPRGVYADASAGTPVGGWMERAALESLLGHAPRLVRPAPFAFGSQRVLITGASGSLGRELLPRLLARLDPSAHVHVLVRRSDALAGLGASCLDPRLSLHLGDVRDPHLGLAATLYRQLAEATHAVIHLAAALGGAAPLEALLPTNLEGTRHVLAFATTGRPKALLYASTLSLFTEARPRPQPCTEDDTLARCDAIATPYAQSKWLAEQLLRRADPDAQAATVVRLGLLTGTAADGRGAERGHLARVIRGLVQLGAFPEPHDAQLAFDVTPLDHAAETCLDLFQRDQAAAAGGTYHVAAERAASVDELLQALDAAGVPLSPLPLQEVFARAIALSDPSGDAALAALSFARARPDVFHRHRGLDLFAATGAHFSLVATSRALASTSYRPPQVTPALLRLYVTRALA